MRQSKLVVGKRVLARVLTPVRNRSYVGDEGGREVGKVEKKNV